MEENELCTSYEIVEQACYEDYRRIQDAYDKQYDKFGIALAAVGVVLTFMIAAFEFSHFGLPFGEFNWVHFLVIIGVCFGFLTVIVSFVFLCLLMRSNEIPVFKCEDLKKDEIYKKSKEETYQWLIDAYSEIVEKMRPIVNERQKKFDFTIGLTAIGMIIYSICGFVGGFYV